MTLRKSLNLQTLYEEAYSNFKEAQYKEAEEQLLELMYHSLEQMNYTLYLNASSLLNRVYINTMNYKLLGKNLFKQTVYINDYANEEQQLLFRLHTAVFNHYFKIGDIEAEIEELFEELYNTSYYQLTATTANYLMLVYLELHQNKKAIQLVQKTNTVINKFHFDNPMAFYEYQIYSFFAYYGLRMYKECDAILSDIEESISFSQINHSAPMYGAAKALQIAQSDRIEDAKQLFDESLETMKNNEHIRLSLGYWVNVLLLNGLYKEATSYQQLHIKKLEDMYSTEINCLRKQVIEMRSQQSFEYLAFQDSLTGVYNRNYYEWITKKNVIFKRYTLVLLDLDLFKRINDTGGHMKGDEALKIVASKLHDFTDQYSEARVIRYGGDEIILCMPYAYSKVKEAISALHKQILSQYVMIDDKPFYISVSMGIGYTEKENTTVASLFQLADEALYKAKEKRGIIVERCIHE